LDNRGCIGHTRAARDEGDTSPMADIGVLHGPNLNLLGTREPDRYGTTTLAAIDRGLADKASAAGHTLEAFQSNAEHELVAHVQRAGDAGVDWLICNPAALTHTSIALRDALQATGIPFIETHLSNVHAREPFRHHSYLSDLAEGVIAGLGAHGYELALLAILARLEH
jgi:3-dehydroquinate dehydratase-2